MLSHDASLMAEEPLASLLNQGFVDYYSHKNWIAVSRDRKHALEIHMSAIALPFVPVGKIKSFGPLGPRYEIGPLLRTLPDGDWMVAITLVESGEKTEYRLAHLIEDPDAL